MKSLYFIAFLTSISLSVNAQPFWTEDFGTGCNQGQLAANYTGANGSWTVTDFTSGNNGANKFYVSATEAGMGDGNCGDGCLATGGTNATLHVSSQYIEYMGFPIVNADVGAAYNVGGIQSFGFISETNMVARSPVIDCSGYQNIVLSFEYMEGGDVNDDANLRYYDGTAWATLDPLAKTTTCPSGQGRWSTFTYNLPSTIDNLSNFQIAFGWVNNDDGAGTDPSFAVDNIQLSVGVPTGISQMTDASDLRIFQNPGWIEVAFTDVDEEIQIINGYDILGQLVVTESFNGNASAELNVSGLNGILVLQIETKNGMHTRKVVLR